MLFFISNLVRIGSVIFRNLFKSYFCLSEAPAGAFFSEKWHISRILDMSNPQKMTFKLLLSVGCSRRGFFFWKMTHFHIFWHDNFPKSVFLIKNSIFGVIKYQNIDMFAHILGPLTNDPFIKKIKIAPKAQPGICVDFLKTLRRIVMRVL